MFNISVEMVGGRYVKPIQTREYLGWATELKNDNKYRVFVITYFTEFFSGQSSKQLAFKQIVREAKWSILAKNQKDIPLVIIISNTLEDQNILQEELVGILGNSQKVVVLSRNEVISNPRI